MVFLTSRSVEEIKRRFSHSIQASISRRLFLWCLSVFNCEDYMHSLLIVRSMLLSSNADSYTEQREE